MRKTVVALAVLSLALLAPTPAFAADRHHDRHHGNGSSPRRPHFSQTWGDDGADSDSSDDSSSDGGTDSGDDSADVTAPDPVAAGGGSALSVPLSGSARTITASLSGYSFQDNTPLGSSTISMPVLHSKAGGTGTFADPITTAVPGSASSPETPKGTKIYVPKLRKYFLVEDSGATKESTTHFDLYVGGEGFSKSASDKCMNSYTGDSQVIINPPATEPVGHVGPLTGANGCVI